MAEEKKLALLIDSDNVSAKYVQFILQEASKYGELTCKRVYGDWEKGNNGWHFPALNNSILPVQQTCYIAGKNATDFSMIIDAMDLLYSGTVDGFVLVTSDSDFTRLAIRLREAGKLVIGIGETKTPIAFTSSCHHFSFLDQVCENAGDYDEKILRKAMLDFVRENDDGRLDLAKIDSFLTSRYGNIDFDALGFKRLSGFIDSFPELQRRSTFVSLKTQPQETIIPEPSVNEADAPSEKEITNVIVEFLKRKEGGEEELNKVSDYVTSTFGKIDFSRFGSKRFAKFIDKRSELVRKDTVVSLAVKQTPKVMKITGEAFSKEIVKYASDNMPAGGNLGQLNNMLITKYGKSYVTDLGFSDFAAAMSSVKTVKTEKNCVFIVNAEPEKKAKTAKAENAEKTETPPKKKTAAKTTVEKPDLNTIKQDILTSCAQEQDEGVLLAPLGAFFTNKYGKDYLKSLGFGTFKKLITQIKGVSIKDERLYIDKDFMERTRQIEDFVFNFAKEADGCSVRMLSSKIKKNFPDFDFGDYGYAKFSDFINAIDGVHADGYYVVLEKK